MDWPKGHKFIVQKLKPRDMWMTDNYRVGGTIGMDDYQTTTPKHCVSLTLNKIKYHGTHLHCVEDLQPITFVEIIRKEIYSNVPNWKKKAKHAYWVVAHNLLTIGKYI